MLKFSSDYTGFSGLRNSDKSPYLYSRFRPHLVTFAFVLRCGHASLLCWLNQWFVLCLVFHRTRRSLGRSDARCCWKCYSVYWCWSVNLLKCRMIYSESARDCVPCFLSTSARRRGPNQQYFGHWSQLSARPFWYQLESLYPRLSLDYKKTVSQVLILVFYGT